MSAFVVATVLSFGTIFVAELGDKSQLMALAFATRYPALPVIVGVGTATAAVHAVSVAIGYGLGSALPVQWVNVVAAVSFAGFGLWTLRGDTLTAGEEVKAATSRQRSAIVAASFAFFLAELGDKTMLATITLATQYGWFGVWLGSTLGMVLADALAVCVGKRLGTRLPERIVKYGAASLFFGFAIWLGVVAAERFSERRSSRWLSELIDHQIVAWLALGLALAAVVAVRVQRHRLGAGFRKEPEGRAAFWARLLLLLATASGMAAPLLVALDLVDPVGPLSDPGLVMAGAVMLFLGMGALLFVLGRTGRASVQGKTLQTKGIFGRIRYPGATGMIVATAGMFLMVPTVLAVFPTVMLIVSAQLKARFVTEPEMVQRHGDRYAAYAQNVGRFLPKLVFRS